MNYMIFGNDRKCVFHPQTPKIRFKEFLNQYSIITHITKTISNYYFFVLKLWFENPTQPNNCVESILNLLERPKY